MPITLRKIRHTVAHLLVERNVRKPPVDVEKIIQSLDIRIERFNDQVLERAKLSGFAFKSNGTRVIGVNSTHSPERMRFTMAHELGHLLLHDREGVHVDEAYSLRLRNDASSEGTNWEEVEANRFAAELLMPEHFLQKDLEDMITFDPLDDEKINDLAKKYKVSKQALLIRISSLGFILPD